MSEFVIPGAEAGTDLGRVRLVSGTMGGLDATHDQAGEIDEGGEQEFMRVLLLSGTAEQLVQESGLESVLQSAPEHDRNGTLVHKLFKDLTQDHDRLLPERAGTCTTSIQ
jgi:hypothetical protein